MKIAYFPAQVALNGAPVMEAVLSCLQAAGHETQENSWCADAAVIWSVLWSGRMAANQAVHAHYRSLGLPVIIVEVGALRRGCTWKISVNNVTTQGYYGHQTQLDWDRSCKLGISLATQTVTTPEIVIALQHVKSLQVESITNMTQWVRDQIQLIRNNSDRPIVVRPHPRSPLHIPNLPVGVTLQRPNRVTGTYDSYDMHYDCHAVVNHNSGPGIQAAIAGVRPIVDNTSLAAPVAVQYADIEKPYTVNRDLWLTQICHTEYTIPEIRTGLWLNRLASALNQ